MTRKYSTTKDFILNELSARNNTVILRLSDGRWYVTQGIENSTEEVEREGYGETLLKAIQNLQDVGARGE